MADEPIINAPEPAASPEPAAAPDTGTMSGDAPAASESTLDLNAFRTALAGDDAGFAKQLDRYRTPADMGKAWRTAVQTAQQKQAPLALAADATDEQKAAYREAAGIPDTPDAYPINFREGFEAKEADTALLSDFKAKLHEAGGDPRTASVAMDWYQDVLAQSQQDRDARLAEVRKETQATLRAEYGNEYDGNISAASELMKVHLGEEGHKDMMDLRLEDGSMLQDKPEFVKMMAALGVDYYGSNGIINGDVETTAKSIDEKLTEFQKLQQDDPNKYYSDAVQAEVAAVYAQKAKLDARNK